MKIAVISDIHANIFALQAVLQDIDKNGCEKIYILGDLVGYYYWPKQVIDLIRSDERMVTIRGNHEDLLARSLKDPEFLELCKRKYGSGLEYCREQLSGDDLKWLDELPESEQLKVEGVELGFFHGSDLHVDEYVYPDVSPARLDEISGFDFVFFGHTHYPVVFSRPNCTVVNPGSVGQPRDVGSLASYVVFDVANLALAKRRVPFDSKPIKEKAQEIDPGCSYLVRILERNNPYA
ncbi:metallophosphoesterase family protein [bacterium SCSIO 12696]|uniref:metallophosphoesterase family protein n=1 Tax=Porticoccus sp. W117 TaxID=3054777 RepID=UPI00220C0C34|nr:metallophosphoesterase family protein [Porticoccus sp. W117]MDM3872381.1 metallophosphoesterase family protein [Porticoccus sp. W117]UTW46026.1 metallophosphoesterase family protein [bacterium SCSIO 12696]